MSRVARRVITAGSWVVVTVAVLLALGVVVLSGVFGWEFSTVLTGSMEPRYPVGSMVIVVPVEPAELAAGDVITFSDGGRRVSHRIVEVTGPAGSRSFITKGDANNVTDREPVPQESVIGQVRADLPMVGEAVGWIRTPAGVGVVTGLVVAMLLFGVIGRLGEARSPEARSPEARSAEARSTEAHLAPQK